ncbi:unnamed protein product, partial [Rotaria sp. Silwood1]
MSTILAARYHQGKSQAAVMRGGEQEEYMRGDLPQNVLATARDKSAKQIVNQNFGKSVNNQTPADNATKIDQYSQSSIQATSSSSNGMDFQDIHHQASNTCKKKRYFKHIRCQGSPVCLILSLLGLVLLGAGIAAMLVALIGIFTTTITATTTSATTTT